MKPLFAVREVLQKQGMASASQIAAELKLSVGLVEDMLMYWRRRGMVEQVSVGTRESCGRSCSSGACGSCGNAMTSSVQAYRWCDGNLLVEKLPCKWKME
ncbi:hypothetical protein HF285_09495 [Acidithiobacillus ferrooxidans F221]|uniref:FeoC-like transcriptional regulator n=1 Tax=Acidithiobacillus ferrooxidans TaxID=920 RepID=UPI001C076A07|nr:FeoC-like transcriptional regulator [Acidithiobacillus ferrooxidans]MBU2808486.1 hypothetical protein [Acidithiobacillus ferrooxidans F221]